MAEGNPVHGYRSQPGRTAAETTQRQRLPEHDVMNSLIGKWITAGETIPANGEPAIKIHASDIYEWVPGAFFVAHTAYGRIGDSDVGGLELIGYDPEPRSTERISSTPKETSATRT